MGFSSSSEGRGVLMMRRRRSWDLESVGAILTSWRQRMWGQFHRLRFARREEGGGGGGGGFEEWEVGLRKVVMGGVEGGRKGVMPLMFQE